MNTRRIERGSRGMLEILPSDGQTFRYRVSGVLTREDLLRLYEAVDRRYQQQGPVDACVEARGFRGYRDLSAVLTLVRHERKLLKKYRSYRLLSGQAWLRGIVRVGGRFVPGLRVHVEKPAPGRSC